MLPLFHAVERMFQDWNVMLADSVFLGDSAQRLSDGTIYCWIFKAQGGHNKEFFRSSQEIVLVLLQELVETANNFYY